MELESITLIFGADADNITLPAFAVNHLFLNNITSLKFFDKKIKNRKSNDLFSVGYLYLILDRTLLLDEDIDKILNKYSISKIILDYKEKFCENYLTSDLNNYEEPFVNFNQSIVLYDDALVIKVGKEEFNLTNINEKLLI